MQCSYSPSFISSLWFQCLKFSDVDTHSVCDLRFQVLVGHGSLDSLPLIQHVLQLLSFQSCAFASLLFDSYYSV